MCIILLLCTCTAIDVIPNYTIILYLAWEDQRQKVYFIFYNFASTLNYEYMQPAVMYSLSLLLLSLL